ncbi:MAG: Holliday junction branch migration protein RuvA [Erysipelotrichaceae bacterium]
MIAFVKGVVVSKEEDCVIVDHRGLGYRIHVPNPHLISMEGELLFHTYHHVREDAQMLFGFLQQQEYTMFCKLIGVKGVGPKTALHILGACDVAALVQAIASNDVAFIKKLPGIGPKSASQIVLDLKGKLVEAEAKPTTIQNPLVDDAVDALKALGYKAVEINSVKKELAAYQASSSNDMVRYALQLMLKRKG